MEREISAGFAVETHFYFKFILNLFDQFYRHGPYLFFQHLDPHISGRALCEGNSTKLQPL